MRVDLVQLARTARAGDAAALDELLAAARPLMLRWAGRLVDEHAEDVVQDALIEVHRTITTLREPAAVAGWLHLAVRKHADRHRRRRVVLDLDLPTPPSNDPADLAGEAEDRAVIRRALTLTKDADRLLLVLRYYADWPESDLAALLGIRTGAVRKRLHDARRRLRALAVPARTTSTQDPWEKLMTDVRTLLGTMYDLDDPMAALPPGSPPLSRPTTPDRLTTGNRALDALAPLVRGGVADLTGPIGSGHLLLIAELLHHLTTTGPAALVAVTSAERSPTGASPRLWKLLDAQAPAAAHTAVLAAPNGREAETVALAARLSAWLAHTGATVLLAVDETVAARTDPFTNAVGTTPTGTVTGIRVAAHLPTAQPSPPWPTANTQIHLAPTATQTLKQLLT